MGGGKRIVKVASMIVPFMGIIYVIVALIMMIVNIGNLPGIFAKIFEDAFNFRAIFSGVAGSSMVYGIKRGLYSNEAGVGSAPNAAAAANVSHPVKQGLVQMLSVFLDTLLICSATAFMSLSSGIEPLAEYAGAQYVQMSLSTLFGSFGPIFITAAMVLFAFTTLIGNLYYVDNCLAFINKKMPGKTFMTAFRLVCAVIIFIGAGLSMGLAWDIADVLMAFMCLINIPACIMLGRVAIDALKDYERQKSEGKNPVFKGASIGLDEAQLDFWK